ncbi:hypothetical protein EDB19DRAFT_1676332 [Suillus lakei]|nr:hypothetical protein EDB19DRAFT_1676332 [Suillus lakei]
MSSIATLLSLPLCNSTSSGTCIQHADDSSRCISDFCIMWYSKRCTKPCSVPHLIPSKMKKMRYIASLCLV